MTENDIIRKISGLLAKAEGTDNEHEAAAFFEKAQELMIKHAIEEAQVRADKIARDGRKVENPIQVDFMYATNDAHAKGKIALVQAVAKAHHVKVIAYRTSTSTSAWFARKNKVEANKYAQWCILVGYAQDLENPKTLYASLLIQWTRFVRQDALGAGLAKTEEFGFRTGHLVGFAARIRRRLVDLNERIVSAANANALMVDKDTEVEAFYRQAFGIISYCYAREPRDQAPRKNAILRYCIMEKGHEGDHDYTYKPSNTGGGSRSRAVDYSGYNAGVSAADRANIGQVGVGSSTQRTIGS